MKDCIETGAAAYCLAIILPKILHTGWCIVQLQIQLLGWIQERCRRNTALKYVRLSIATLLGTSVAMLSAVHYEGGQAPYFFFLFIWNLNR